MRYYFNHELTYAKIVSEAKIEDDITTNKNGLSSIEDFLEKTMIRYPTLGKKALVLGCGMGRTCLYLAKRGFSVTGIDVSPTAIEIARKKSNLTEGHYQNPSFLVMDVIEMSFPDSFDLIVDDHCLHCLVHSQDRQDYFKQVKKYLRVDGLFVFESIVFDEGIRFAPSFLLDMEYILWMKTPSERCYDLNRINNEFYIPFRKVAPAHTVENELIGNNFMILYFYYCQHLKCEIPGNGPIPMKNWPSIIRVHARNFNS